jgi:hypothetical protein
MIRVPFLGGSTHHSAECSSESQQTSTFKCQFAEGNFDVEIFHAPIKTFARMMEKVLAQSTRRAVERFSLVKMLITLDNIASAVFEV